MTVDQSAPALSALCPSDSWRLAQLLDDLDVPLTAGQRVEVARKAHTAGFRWVPPGCAVVPSEPTPAMLEVLEKAIGHRMDLGLMLRAAMMVGAVSLRTHFSLSAPPRAAG